MKSPISLYKIKIQIKNIEEDDKICIFGIKNCLLYFGNISKENNIIEFNYSNCGIYELFDKENKWIDEINFKVLSIIKEYEYEILSTEEIKEYKTLIIVGDSHSYYHLKINKYYSWSQYFHYIVNDNIMIINLSKSGQNLNCEILRFNEFNKKIKDIDFDNNYLLWCDGANTSKHEKFQVIHHKLNCKNIQKKYFFKMYPIKYGKKIILRANNIIDFLHNWAIENNFDYFDIDNEFINNEDYLNNGFNDFGTHTNLYGGILIGNCLRNKLREFGLNIFNDNNLIDDYKLVDDIIKKYYLYE